MTAKPPSKRAIVARILIVLLLGAGVTAFLLYRRGAPERMARLAQAALDKGDLRLATLAATRALQLAPKNISAARIMAEAADRSGSPEAFAWRRRVCELVPGSAPDEIALAVTSLHFGQIQEAQRALTRVGPAARTTADFQACQGAVAFALSNFAVARSCFAQALRLRPEDDAIRFDYACTLLHWNDPEDHQVARDALEKLSAQPKYRLLALRTLAADALARRRWDDALQSSRALEASPGAEFNDRLTLLDALRGEGKDETSSYLKGLEERAAKNATDAGALIAWMSKNGLSDSALAWYGTLPQEIAKAPQPSAAIATCLMLKKDWSGLEAMAASGNWGSLEFLRLALWARALRELGHEDAARAEWQAAIVEAEKKGSGLEQLAHLAIDWSWESEATALLRQVAERVPGAAPWALEALYKEYSAQGDTPGLRDVSKKMMELDPENDAAKNNFAMLSMLLKQNLPDAFRIAGELWNKLPKNPYCASTYAYAMYLQHQPAKALQVMNGLSSEQLADPSTAVYYALILVANGKGAEAEHYFDLAKSGSLLPEEKAILPSAATP